MKETPHAAIKKNNIALFIVRCLTVACEKKTSNLFCAKSEYLFEENGMRRQLLEGHQTSSKKNRHSIGTQLCQILFAPKHNSMANVLERFSHIQLFEHVDLQVNEASFLFYFSF